MNERENVLVTIVVPIYNVEDYLEACLESLRGQSYSNIEIIMVDDGSEDSSTQICQRFALNDPRFLYIRQENRGLSAARNTGIEHARGDYIAFVDGDDFVHEHYTRMLIAASSRFCCDIVVCGYCTCDPNGKSGFSSFSGSLHAEDSVTGKEAFRRFLVRHSIIDVVAWNKLYRTSLFSSGIRYPSGRLHEDVFTTYLLLAAAEKVTYIPQCLYYYSLREGSIMSEFGTRNLDKLDAAVEITEFIMRRYPDFLLEGDAFNALTRYSLLCRMLDSRNYSSWMGEYRAISGSINLARCLHNENLSFLRKLNIIFLVKFPRAARVLRRGRSLFRGSVIPCLQ